MDEPEREGWRRSIATRLGLLVAATAILVLFNPWIALAVAGGIALGQAIRWLIRAIRRNPKRSLVATALSIGVALAGISAAAFILYDEDLYSSDPNERAEHGVPYRMEARYGDDGFVVRDEFVLSREDIGKTAKTVLLPRTPDDANFLSDFLSSGVPVEYLTGTHSLTALILAGASPEALIQAGAGPRNVRRAAKAASPAALRQLVVAAFARSGYELEKTVNGNLVFRSEARTLHAPIRTWPLRTTLQLPIPNVAMGHDTFVRPAPSSTVDVVADESIVERTFPASTPQEVGAGDVRHHIVLGDDLDSLLDEADTVTIEANSVLARNPIVAKVQSISLWDPLVWIFGVLAVIFSEEIKRRIKRVLRLDRESRQAPLPPATAQ